MQPIALAILLASLGAGQVPVDTDWGRFAYPDWDRPAPRVPQMPREPLGQLKRGQTPGTLPQWANIHPRLVTLPPMPPPMKQKLSDGRQSKSMPKGQSLRKLYGPGGVRRDLGTLDPGSQTMQSYRRAIEAMRRLPPSDPHSLAFQANIHGFEPVANPHPLWGQCQHGSWWFFPWHRAYIHYVERIMRRYADDPSFCLPYWDHAKAQERTLPLAFRDPNSPLYDGTRRPEVNDGSDQLDPAIVVTGTNASLANTTFADFGDVVTFGGPAMNAPVHASRPHGAYESVPHDIVHGFVGGNMNNPDAAARDPIFFCHHSNVDRMWEEWLALGQGRANPANDIWLDQQFTFFDENKQQVTIRVRDLLDTTTLGYSYDTIGTPAPNVTRQALTTVTENLVVVKTPGQSLSATPVHVTVSIPEAALGKLQKNLLGARMPLAPVPSQVQLRLEGVQFSGVPDSAVAVYFNLPRDASKPDPRSPYFAGCFTFFDHDHGGARTSHLDVTKHLQRLWPYTDRNSRDVKVTLVRVSCGTLPCDFKTACTCGQLSLAVCK